MAKARAVIGSLVIAALVAGQIYYHLWVELAVTVVGLPLLIVLLPPLMRWFYRVRA